MVRMTVSRTGVQSKAGVADGDSGRHSSDLFIDGSSAGGSGRYPTINPATEEVLGTAADGDAADMERAIGAARRAFDTTDWSTDTELGALHPPAPRCHEGEHRGTARADHRRGRAPRMLTAMAQLEGPVDDLSFCADTAETYEWRQDLGVASPMGIKTRRTIAREAVGVVGAITPWNFPHQINLAKLGRPWRPETPSSSNRHPTPLVRSGSG
jgi:aldehyde dehydrogenase (NAD+)